MALNFSSLVVRICCICSCVGLAPLVLMANAIFVDSSSASYTDLRWSGVRVSNLSQLLALFCATLSGVLVGCEACGPPGVAGAFCCALAWFSVTTVVSKEHIRMIFFIFLFF